MIRFAPLISHWRLSHNSVTEDYLFTLRLKEGGFTHVYLNEPLTLGLAPKVQGIHHSTRPLVPRLHADRPRAARARSRASAGISLLDRLFLIDNFLNWFAAHG